jgi:hypothetical protein
MPATAHAHTAVVALTAELDPQLVPPRPRALARPALRRAPARQSHWHALEPLMIHLSRWPTRARAAQDADTVPEMTGAVLEARVLFRESPRRWHLPWPAAAAAAAASVPGARGATPLLL